MKIQQNMLFVIAASMIVSLTGLGTAPSVNAVTTKNACHQDVAKTLYSRKSFYRGGSRLTTASLAVYKTSRTKGEYCIVAYSWSGSYIKGVESTKHTRSSTSASWKPLTSTRKTLRTTYYSFSTNQTSRLKGVSYGFIADNERGDRYYAFTPILTYR